MIHTRGTTGGGEGLPKCTFCGQPHATAFWHGDGVTIEVCRQCATGALPALIADALAGPILQDGRQRGRDQYMAFQGAIPQILATFWRSAAIALSGHLDPPPEAGES